MVSKTINRGSSPRGPAPKSLFLNFDVLGVFFAPTTILLEVDLAFDFLLVFTTPVIDSFAVLTG